MLFKRRAKPGIGERLRVALWPRRNWARSFRYVVKRVLRLSATPHAIATGFAGGAFASITPFVGLHLVLGLAIGWLTRGNLVAAVFGTLLGNPLTFPLIWTGTYRLGSWILDFEHRAGPPIDISGGIFEHSWDVLVPVFEPMLVGAALIGILVWLGSYIIVRSLVRTYQEGRRTRFAERIAARRAAAAEINPGK